MLLGGLDIGTTGCKITVYTSDGKLLKRFYQDYPLSRSTDVHEVDAQDIWEAVQQVLADAFAVYPDIRSIGVTSFGETFVLLDENDRPLRRCMLYTDPRGAEECGELVNMLGKERLSGITGLNPHSMYSLPKLMWIKKHQPELYRKAKRVLQMEDYIVYMLTGNAQIDYSLASRTMAFDIQKLQWSDEIFTAAGIDQSLFSTPVPIGSHAGTVLPKVNTANIGKETMICSCGQDQIAAAVGSGVFDQTTAVDGAGTVECITPVFHTIPELGKMARGSYAIVPYVEPGSYVTYAFSYTGGALIQWFVDNLAGYASAQASAAGQSIYAELEGDGTAEKPTGLLVLPHFAGAATPYMDTGSKGAVLGLTVASTQQEIYRGLMEGVCYEMRLNMERLRDSGIEIRQLHATGGGANSRLWTQMKADILNVPIRALESGEAGATGSVMMAGVASSLFPDLRSAVKVFVKQRETFLPRPAVHGGYMKVYERYKKLYQAVRPLMEGESIC